MARKRKSRKEEPLIPSKRIRFVVSSSSEDEINVGEVLNNSAPDHVVNELAVSPQSSTGPEVVLVDIAAPTDAQGPEPSQENDPVPEAVELEEDILLLLGEAPTVQVDLGPPIHKDIAVRWQEILSKGLQKDTKDKLLKDYFVPSNCDFLSAPALNEEVKIPVPDLLLKRDAILMYKQKQLGIALAALATATDLIVSNESSKQKILKPISDAGRLLCDLHFNETKLRRKFVMSSVTPSLRDTLVESTRDKFLFGENLNEKLKVSKAIIRTGEALKQNSKNIFNKNNFAFKFGSQNRLNFKPHRKTDHKNVPEMNRGRPAARYQYQQAQPSTSRQPPPPPLPARYRSPPARPRSPPPPRRNPRRF